MSGYSCSVTGLERVVRTAIEPDHQYIATLKTRAIPRPTTAPWGPQNEPITTNSPPRAAINTQVFSRLMPGLIERSPLLEGTVDRRERPVQPPKPSEATSPSR